MEHVLHDADRLIPILFKGQDISFLSNVKETVREHTQEFKWKSIILNISMGMAREEMDTFINLNPPHVGPVVLDATAHTPEHEVFYDDALLVARKERLIRLNDTTKDVMYLLYGIHSLPTPLQLSLGMARFYYMGVTIDRLLEIEADIDAYTDEPSYRSGLKKALSAVNAAHDIYTHDSPFRETHINEEAHRIEVEKHMALSATAAFSGLAAAYAATHSSQLKTQISSMLDEINNNPEIFKHPGLALDDKPGHVNALTEVIPAKNLLKDIARNEAALVATENNPRATATLLNSSATSDAVHRSAYLTDALEDNTETQNLLHNNPANHHAHTFELKEPRQPQAAEATKTDTAHPIQAHPIQTHPIQTHQEHPHEHPSIPLLHETNRYSEIKAITTPDMPDKHTAHAANEHAVTAHAEAAHAETSKATTPHAMHTDTVQHTAHAQHHPEHYEAYAAEHEQELPRRTRTTEALSDTPRETQDTSRSEPASSQQAHAVDSARNEERTQPAQPSQGAEQPDDRAQERSADTGDNIARHADTEELIAHAAHIHTEAQPTEQSQPDRHAQDARTLAEPYDSEQKFIDENIKESRDPRNGETQIEARQAQQQHPAEELRREDIRREVAHEEIARQDRRQEQIDENAKAMHRTSQEAIERTRTDAKIQTASREQADYEAEQEKPEMPDVIETISKNLPKPEKRREEGRDERRLEQREAQSYDADTRKAVLENAELNEHERSIAAMDNMERHRTAEMSNVAEREAIDLAQSGFVTSNTPKHDKHEKDKKEPEHPHHPDDTPKPEPI